MIRTFRLAAAFSALPLLLLTGCGMVAAPQAPSLKLPEQVTDLAAQRTGDHVDLHWTMPKHATDKVPLVGKQKVQVCRQLASEPCITAGNVLVAPGVEGSFTDTLPQPLTTGPLRVLTYTVLLQNKAGRSAGPSNAAVTAAGAAPPQVEDLQARAQAEGVVLSWKLIAADETIRLNRKLADRPVAPNSSLPAEQTLEFSGHDQGRVLDRDAALDHTYTYTAQRVATLTAGDKAIEVLSDPTDNVTINARDVFPPAIPQGLQAVPDAVAHSIDLSWQPDTEADLAGYIVYRRESGSNAPPQRLSPASQTAASFSDTTALPGHTYAYSVSAIDHDGNESQRSPEVEETIPQ
jgi:hypothetical protein